MWKTRFFLRAATAFFPQAYVENEEVFNMLCGRNRIKRIFTIILSTFHRSCGKIKGRS